MQFPDDVIAEQSAQDELVQDICSECSAALYCTCCTVSSRRVHGFPRPARNVHPRSTQTCLRSASNARSHHCPPSVPKPCCSRHFAAATLIRFFFFPPSPNPHTLLFFFPWKGTLALNSSDAKGLLKHCTWNKAAALSLAFDKPEELASLGIHPGGRSRNKQTTPFSNRKSAREH